MRTRALLQTIGFGWVTSNRRVLLSNEGVHVVFGIGVKLSVFREPRYTSERAQLLFGMAAAPFENAFVMRELTEIRTGAVPTHFVLNEHALHMALNERS